MQIKLYTRSYTPLTTLFVSRTTSDFNNLVYRDTLMGIGDASFTMRLDNLKTTLANIKHYNIVEICEEDGTPRWVGVIVSKRILFNVVSISCYGLLHVLTKRLTGDGEAYTTTAAGSIASTLLSNANGNEDTRIIAGVMDDPAVISLTFNRASVYDAIRRISESSDGQFRLNPDRTLDVDDLVGSDLSDSVIFQYRLALIASANVLSFQVDDDGSNILSKTYGKSGALTSTQEDATLRGEYGLLEDSNDFREIDDQDALDTATQGNNNGSELSPSLDLSPKVEDNFEIGDTVRVILENRIVAINDAYQITEKTVTVKGGNQKQISVRVISNTSDFFKLIRDLKRKVDLLDRST